MNWGIHEIDTLIINGSMPLIITDFTGLYVGFTHYFIRDTYILIKAYPLFMI